MFSKRYESSSSPSSYVTSRTHNASAFYKSSRIESPFPCARIAPHTNSRRDKRKWLIAPFFFASLFISLPFFLFHWSDFRIKKYARPSVVIENLRTWKIDKAQPNEKRSVNRFYCDDNDRKQEYSDGYD